MNRPKLDFPALLGDLDAGVFLDKVTRAIQEAAIATGVHGDKGKQGSVTLKFDFARHGDSQSHMTCVHKITTTKPEPKGKTTTENTTETPLYLNRHGIPSVLPESEQEDWLNSNQE
ncbi:MAG: hypothetical protein JJU06_05985 [Ectothiorhodospiraceae bacterium]|nr:hypothetical protein [Ectothiorhodospiraceae bacterium]